MRYKTFRVRNFKGIRDTVVDLTSDTGVGVFALVGLNESGKTTLLEAIHAFSPDYSTRMLLGHDLQDKRLFKDWVPRHEISTFTGRISIEAAVTLTGDDRQQIVQNAKVDYELTIDPDSIPDEVSVERWVEFKRGDYVSNGHGCAHDLQVKVDKERKWHSAKGDQRGGVANAIYDAMPDIAFFPTFIFKFPDRIYLTLRGGPINGFYRRTFQDILDYDGKGFTIDEDIVRRVRADDFQIDWLSFLRLWSGHDDKDKIDHVIARASSVVTRLVFGRWNKIFHEDAQGKEVLISWDVDEGEVTTNGQIQKTNTHDVFIQFSIKDGTRRFPVNSRSQGFRWFFAFMLFTQFRAARKNTRSVLFLFDEPASNLHAAAQQKLVESFPEIAREGSMLIYSTHSHYMVEPKWLEQTFIVSNRSDDPKASVIDAVSLDDESLDIKAQRYRSFVDEHPNQTSYYQPILDRLEVVPSRFDVLRPIIVVEGKSDFYILRYAEQLLKTEALPLVPATGAGTMDALVALSAGWGLRSLFLLDADAAGKAAKERYQADYLVSDARLLTLDDLLPNLTKIEGLLDNEAKGVVQLSLRLTVAPNKKQIQRYFQESLASDRVRPLGKAFARRVAQVLEGLKNRLE
jgi:ABC-type Na+ transport system ATPase subunit NatA